MRIISRVQIEDWAKTYGFKADLPVLVSRLVRGSMPPNTLTFFPTGTAVNVSGYDGIVQSEFDYRYVPIGTSLWEFGTEKGVKAKADDDYDKRTEDPLGQEPTNCTLVFLTPRFWKDKDAWQNAKRAEKIWKDVRAYDSRDIEEWLDEVPAVARWFAAQINVLPFDGIITVEEFWHEFAHGKAGVFPPSILTGGREYQMGQLFDFLNGEPDIFAVKAATRDEATAFIIACAKQFEASAHTTFVSKSLIIDSEANFRSMQNNIRNLNLIARFDKRSILYPAVEKRHHVLVPLGPDDSFNQVTLELPGLDRELQVKALQEMGFSDEDSRKLSIDAGRDITVLRRLLKFPQDRITWISEDLNEIIPALLLGRWYRQKPGDRQLIEMLSGESYDQYEEKLYKWAEFPESPILQIGETWRLTSPLDAWTNIGHSVQKKHFVGLQTAVQMALRDGNPYVESKSTNPFELISSNEKQYSRWVREGIAQSLILIGYYGNGINLHGIGNPQDWVDELIDSLFQGADSARWIGLDRELPLLAEAAPDCFLQKVSFSLGTPEETLLPMLKEEDGFLTPIAHHTGMLWALEALSWLPEYLLESTLLLAKLAKLDPGIKLANKPINSLLEIYKSWHPQTLATLEQRMEILGSMVKVESEVAWRVLFSMLHRGRDTAMQTHRPRWRLYGKLKDESIIDREYWATGEQALQLLFPMIGDDPVKIAKLLDRSTELDSGQRDRIIRYAKENFPHIPDPDAMVWAQLRKILSENRSHPDAAWALPEDQLLGYAELYVLFEPEDLILKTRYLFDEHWPNFPEGGNVRTSIAVDSHGKKIEGARVEAIKIYLSQGGISLLTKLASEVKEPWTIGEALSKIENAKEYTGDLLAILDGSEPEIRFAQTFFRSLSYPLDMSWVEGAYKQMQKMELSISAITRYFLSLHQTVELWSFLETLSSDILAAYWKDVQPNLYWMGIENVEFALDHLERYSRHFTAIDVVAHLPDENRLSSTQIQKVLINAANKPSDEKRGFPGYEAGRLFEMLDKRNDLSEGEMIALEYLYLSLLDGHRIQRQPKYLHAELAKNPVSFMEVIKWAYMPKNKELIQAESNELSNEELIHRGQQAYKLLNTMRNIPGVDSEGHLNGDFLKSWSEQVKDLAVKADRTEITNMFIGKLLAQYPENNTDNWPPKSIADVIEEADSEDMLSGFSTSLFNKRGSSVRGAFAGGEIEHNHAAYFGKLAKKHRHSHPKMAKVFSDLAKGYRKSAKEMDDRAARERLDY